MAIGLITYDDTVRKEDVVDVITNISPNKTPLLSSLGQSEARNTLHEYLTASLASASDNASVESAAFTTVDETQPTRLTNITQIFTDNVTVSGTEVAVANYAGNPLEYQVAKNAKEHAKDIEHALMRGSTASGSSGVARRLTGVINGISTNASTRASGSSLGETIFNNILEDVYGQTDEEPNVVFVGGTLKRDISGFTAGNTKNIEASAMKLVNSVDVYESDFGLLSVMLHRDVVNTANAKEIVVLNTDFWKLSFLQGRRTKVEQLSKDGDRYRAQIISELTIENRAEAANAFQGGYAS